RSVLRHQLDDVAGADEAEVSDLLPTEHGRGSRLVETAATLDSRAGNDDRVAPLLREIFLCAERQCRERTGERDGGGAIPKGRSGRESRSHHGSLLPFAVDAA